MQDAGWTSECTSEKYLLLSGSDLLSGPNWIHGTDQNPINDLAERLKQSCLIPSDYDSLIFDKLGHQLNESERTKYTEIMWDIINKAYKYSNDRNAPIIPSDISLMDFFRLEVAKRKLPEKTAAMVLDICRIWGDYIGDPIEKQSLRYLWLEESIDGGMETIWASRECRLLTISLQRTCS